MYEWLKGLFSGGRKAEVADDDDDKPKPAARVAPSPASSPAPAAAATSSRTASNLDAAKTGAAPATAAVPGKPANYERLLPEYDAIIQGKVLLDAAMGFFVLPAKAASFKVWADSPDAPLLVVAHTRPMALAREVFRIHA